MMYKMKKNAHYLLVIILAVLLIGALSYIVYTEVAANRARQQFSLTQQAVQAGYEQAIVTIFQQASTCKPVPIYVRNQTLNLVAAECLKEK